jgi:hypothetical protein
MVYRVVTILLILAASGESKLAFMITSMLSGDIDPVNICIILEICDQTR